MEKEDLSSSIIISKVSKPAHYTHGKIEVITFIEDQNFDMIEGSIIKYIARYKYKDSPILDLLKARWYLNRLIKREKKEIVNR